MGYLFRGQSISGEDAFWLLQDIKNVLAKAPNPTSEDVKVLEIIVADFEKGFDELHRRGKEDKDGR